MLWLSRLMEIPFMRGLGGHEESLGTGAEQPCEGTALFGGGS